VWVQSHRDGANYQSPLVSRNQRRDGPHATSADPPSTVGSESKRVIHLVGGGKSSRGTIVPAWSALMNTVLPVESGQGPRRTDHDAGAFLFGFLLNTVLIFFSFFQKNDVFSEKILS
jgi:hypothetical protein